MSKVESVPFFTPINFENNPKGWSDSLLELADHYFYLGGRTACVISEPNDEGSRETTYKDGESSFIVTALKVASYLTLVLPVIFLVVKTLMRLTSSFHLDGHSRIMDYEGEARIRKVQQILGEGISERAIAIFKAALSGDTPPDSLEWDDENSILAEYPKISFNGHYDVVETEKEMVNRIKMQQICFEEKLNLITFPSARKIDMTITNSEGDELTRPCIAIEQFVASDANTQRNYFKTLSGLENTLKQLVTFIAKNGISELNFDMIQIIDTEKDFKGDRRVAILQLIDEVNEDERIPNASDAVLGNNGLIYLATTEAGIKAIVDEAMRQGIKELYGATIEEISEPLIVKVKAKQDLEKGITVTSEMLDAIRKKLSPDTNSLGRVSYYGGIQSENGFAVQEFPESNLKCYLEYSFFGNDLKISIEDFYEKSLKAHTVIAENKLDQLIVPRAKKFQVELNENNVNGLAVQVIEGSRYNNLNSQFAKKLPEDNERIRQLATFVAWARLPRLPSKVVDSKIVVDELMYIGIQNGGNNGIFGSQNNIGLIDILHSEEQIDIAIKAADAAGVYSGIKSNKLVFAATYKKNRLEHLAKEAATVPQQ